MKNFIFSICITALTVMSVFAQDSTKTKTYKNELGVDGTPFVKQFLNFGEAQYSTRYFTTYYLTYRRHFKSGNIRFAVGGSYFDREEQFQAQIVSSTNNNIYRVAIYSISMRAGWEFFSNISKRWQAFYGLDFRPTLSHYRNDFSGGNDEYVTGHEYHTQTYSASPLLGFRYYLNNRISISTESSFSWSYVIRTGREYYIPRNSIFPSKPDESIPKMKGIEASFQSPVSLFITFDI